MRRSLGVGVSERGFLMISRVRITLLSVSVLFAGWCGYGIFNYFSYNAEPEVAVIGLENDGYYKGVMNCALKADNGYKIALVDVFLDGKPLEVDRAYRVRSKTFTLPFEIDTTQLTNGSHALEVHAIDSSYHRNKKINTSGFFVDNLSLKGAFLNSEQKIEQGRTLRSQIQLNKKVKKIEVKFLAKTYNCYPEENESTVYECFIPVDCEERPNEYVMHASIEDFVGNVIRLTGSVAIHNVNFPKQRGFTVSNEKLDEEKEVSMSNKILSEALEKWLKDSAKQKMWTGPFELPTVVQRYSTPFGEIRTTPERGRYLHRAVDIVNYPKSVVWTAQNGNVIIKDRYLHSGNTVVIDHGLGVFSLYYHLDSFSDIDVGDFVKKGNPIGRVGMTGYANGYHLHWEIRVGGVSVDPLQWTKKSFL
jgi:hypothetical protein